MKKIYFDNASTSFPKTPGLSEYIKNYIENNCVNINRGSYEKTTYLENIIFETRLHLAQFFDCFDDCYSYSNRVVFTPGITFSINCFLRGFLKKNDHIIVSSMEHHAVMRTLHNLKKEGISFSVANCDKNGYSSPKDFEDKINPNTVAILCTTASNVFGVKLPIEGIGEICKKHNIVFAVDTAQTAGTESLSMRKCNIDFLMFTAHKGFLSLQGLGGFIVSEKLDNKINCIITGGTGSQSNQYIQPRFLPDYFESGTLNLPGIAALNYSIKYINKIGLDNIRKKELLLTEKFINEINVLNEVEIIGPKTIKNRISVVSLDFKNRDNSEISYILEKKYGIMTRVGLHCAKLAHESLGTLDKGTVRFSFGYFNTEDEINYCIDAIKKIIASD